MAEIDDKELEALKVKAELAGQLREKLDSAVNQVKQAKRIQDASFAIRDKDQKLYAYLLALSKNLDATSPYDNTPERVNQDDLDPVDSLRAEIMETMDKGFKLVQTQIGQVSKSQSDTSANQELDRLRSRNPDRFDKYYPKMREIAKDMPEILQSPNGLEALMTLASVDDLKEEGKQEALADERSRRALALDTWTPDPTGKGAMKTDKSESELNDMDMPEMIEELWPELLEASAREEARMAGLDTE